MNKFQDRPFVKLLISSKLSWLHLSHYFIRVFLKNRIALY